MAANFIQEDELQEEKFDQIDTTEEQPQAETQETPVAKEEPASVLETVIPDKYKGKSVEDIVKMHQEAEKLIGRQAQEVHEVRSLADQLLKQQLESRTKETAPIEESLEEDFFVDPKQAVNRQVEKHPAVLEAKQAALELKKMKTAQQLAAKHPDFSSIAQDAGFQDWVKSSKVRLALFAKADAEFDFDSADELLSTYKELKQVKQQTQATQTAAVESKGQEQAMRAASVDVGGAGESSRKVYRRADLIKLKLTDPARYEALQDEIMAAYAEGRVK